ncbi:MAG: trigger factor [Flavobacteriales bacterium]|nr:trigger factor [Flavobacteriales bacterium]
MNITKQEVDNLNAVIKLELSEGDYGDKVNQILNDYRKKANMPGFRPGMVPIGMIRKMYGNAVKADEINKVLSSSLYDYIEQNNLEILGNPLPNDEQSNVEDFDKQKDFEFAYDIGLAPQFEISVTAKNKYNQYKIVIDDELLNKNIGDVARRYGSVKEAETSQENDLIQGEFRELGKEEGEGVVHTSTVSLEFLEDEAEKQKLIGKKLGDVVKVNPAKLSKGDTDMAAMLGVQKHELENLSQEFEFQISKIYNLTPAPLEQELFDKIFGEGKISGEEEFRNKIKEELAKALEVDCERKLKKDIYDDLIKKAKMDLPDEFLKRWLKAASKEPIPENIFDEEYEKYADSLRWQLMENKIIKTHELQIQEEEIKAYVRQMVQEQFAMYGQTEMPDEQLDAFGQRILSNEEERNKIYNQLYDKKITEFLKNTCTFKEKEVSYDDFVKLVTEKPSKFNLFNKNFFNKLFK